MGRYVIRRKLGSGGMGIVYGARDRALGRFVALKLVRRAARRASPHDLCFVQRLHREAIALARVSHPHVVSLFDMGSEGDVLFLAMEFVEGEPLSRALARKPLPWREILALFVQAGRGLAAAHAAGVVHRDFKPNNVIVGPGGHVTVVDFGLALGTDRAPRPDEDDFSPSALTKKLTEGNLILGTRGYMAPEQLLGREVGPAADQFALCVALFEALHNTRPYPGSTAIETARAFAAGEIAATERRCLPGYVRRALITGLSVDPADRFASMDALLAALDPAPAARRSLAVAAMVFAAAAASAATTAWLDAGPAAATIACEASARIPGR